MATLCENSGLGGVEKHHKGSAGPQGPTVVGKKSREKPEHMEEGVCAGIIQQCHLPCREGIILEKGGERPLPLLHGQSLHIHTHTHTNNLLIEFIDLALGEKPDLGY